MGGKKIQLTALVCLIICVSGGDIADTVMSRYSQFEGQIPQSLLSIHPKSYTDEEGNVPEATYLTRIDEGVTTISTVRPQNMVLAIPQANADDMVLWMYRATIYTPTAQNCASSQHECWPASDGAHYWGVVVGHEQDSLASISISESEITGQVNIGTFTYVLGNMESGDMQIFYRTDMLGHRPEFKSDTVLPPSHYRPVYPKVTPVDNMTFKQEPVALSCVNIYVEVAQDIYQSFGTIRRTQNWVDAVWAQVFILYANDGFTVQIQKTKIWDDSYPYDATDTGGALNQLKDALGTSFDGNLAHLMALEPYGGGIAYVDVLCFKSYAFAYSAVYTYYSNVPTYSWTVEVLAHEMGHQFASDHTHDCTWGIGKNTAIDCCYQGGNNCPNGVCNAPTPQIPSDGGTIMSYCHLTSVGINFTRGFHPEVKALITEKLQTNYCLFDNVCGGSFAMDKVLALLILILF